MVEVRTVRSVNGPLNILVGAWVVAQVRKAPDNWGLPFCLASSHGEEIPCHTEEEGVQFAQRLLNNQAV